MKKIINNVINVIYMTQFNPETFEFTENKFNVVKESSRYISLEDGRRLDVSEIRDINLSSPFVKNCLESSLMYDHQVFTLKPITSKTKSKVYDLILECCNRDIKYFEDELRFARERVISAQKRLKESKARLEKLSKKISK